MRSFKFEFTFSFLQVTVEDPNSGEAVDFSCQRWFSTSEDDGKISRELNRDDQSDETIVSEGNCNDRNQNNLVFEREGQVNKTTRKNYNN